MGKGPHSTPVFYDGKLYTLGVTAILSCFDAATGDTLHQSSSNSKARGRSSR
jgi:hypothetical protein